MTRVAIELAKPQDNDDILRLMSEMPMPGLIRIAYKRDPDFFRALSVEGRVSQTIIGRELETGRIIGMGVRSIKPAFIDGKNSSIGYLSSLRLIESYRGSIHLARAYKKLRELHNDGKASIYLSSVINDNTAAMRLLQGRACLPAYHDIGQLRTMAISLSQTLPNSRVSGISVRRATQNDLAIIVDFLNEHGKCRQFFPVYSRDDFFKDSGLLRGLRAEDILLAFHDEQLVGIVAAWDQKEFRSNVVHGYSRGMVLGRPFYNLWAKMTRLPLLPAKGSVLKCCYLSLLCIQEDDEAVFYSLLSNLIKLNRDKCTFLLAALHENDPLMQSLSKLRHIEYLSRLFVVCWPDGEGLFTSLSDRIPYVELGAL